MEPPQPKPQPNISQPSKTPVGVEPPPYTQHIDRTAPDTNLPKATIQALDTPRWKWDEHQCREWLCAVLIHCGRAPEEANAMSQEWNGYGIQLYTTRKEQWFEELESLEATTIWSALLEAHANEVPRSFRIHHFKKEAGGN